MQDHWAAAAGMARVHSTASFSKRTGVLGGVANVGAGRVHGLRHVTPALAGLQSKHGAGTKCALQQSAGRSRQLAIHCAKASNRIPYSELRQGRARQSLYSQTRACMNMHALCSFCGELSWLWPVPSSAMLSAQHKPLPYCLPGCRPCPAEEVREHPQVGRKTGISRWCVRLPQLDVHWRQAWDQAGWQACTRAGTG